MTVSVTHATVAVGANDPTKEVSSTAWNESHTITGLGTAAEQNVGYFATAAQGALADSAVQPGDLGALAVKDQADVADINATGTPGSGNFLRGDGTWSTPASGGSADGTAGYVQFSGGSGAFASDSTSGGQFFWDSTNHRLGIGTTSPGSAIEAAGALTLSGSTTTDYTTPVGSSVPTKINIPNFNLSAYGQLVSMGLTGGSHSTARAISLLDERGSAHQPTIAVFDPTENDLFGLSWDGSSSTAYLKTLASNIGIRVHTTDIATFSTTGAVAFASATFTVGGSQVLVASNIGSTVQAYASVLANTTASFTTTLETKLNGIEAAADVTDAANVDAAGAVMNTDTSTASMSFVIDEDNMASDSATKVPTQQSVKAYADGFIAKSLLTTRGQIITRGASAPQALALGTSGYYLKSDGTDAVWAAGPSAGSLVFISEQSASNSSTIEFTSGINSTYSSYEIHLHSVIPATEGQLRMRTSTNAGSSFDSGGSDYQSVLSLITAASSTTTVLNSSGTTFIALCSTSTNGIGNAAGEPGLSGVIRIYRPSDANYCLVMINVVYNDTSGNPRRASGVGMRVTAADVDAVQFIMASGNITSGHFALYGVAD